MNKVSFQNQCETLSKRTQKCVISDGLPEAREDQSTNKNIDQNFHCEFFRINSRYQTLLIHKTFDEGSNIPDISHNECLLFFKGIRDVLANHLTKTPTKLAIESLVNSRDIQQGKNIKVSQLPRSSYNLLFGLCKETISNNLYEESNSIINQLDQLTNIKFEKGSEIIVVVQKKSRIIRQSFKNFFKIQNQKIKNNNIISIPKCENLDNFATTINKKCDPSILKKEIMIVGKNFASNENILSSIAILYNLKKQYKINENHIAPIRLLPSPDFELTMKNIASSIPGSLDRATLNTFKRAIVKKELRELKSTRNTETFNGKQVANLITLISQKQEYLLKPKSKFEEYRSDIAPSIEHHLNQIIKKGDSVTFLELPYLLQSAIITFLCGSVICDIKLFDQETPYYISNFDELYIEIKTGNSSSRNASVPSRSIRINKKMEDGKYQPVVGFSSF